MGVETWLCVTERSCASPQVRRWVVQAQVKRHEVIVSFAAIGHPGTTDPGTPKPSVALDLFSQMPPGRPRASVSGFLPSPPAAPTLREGDQSTGWLLSHQPRWVPVNASSGVRRPALVLYSACLQLNHAGYFPPYAFHGACPRQGLRSDRVGVRCGVTGTGQDQERGQHRHVA